MSDTRPRKLATIVALDVAGYSALTEADEARATAAVGAVRGAVEAIVAKFGGRLFNTAGDGFMLEFGSSVSAVEAALELAQACEPKVRVGVHLGDVAVQPNGDLLGHGVNVAARLMAQALPGSALVSADVRRTIRGAIGERLVSRGLLKLDKMTETIEAFSISTASTNIPVAQAPVAQPVLAVLPFDNSSNDPEMQFFSDGVADEILQLLMKHSELRVIGRTSAFQFRGAAKANAARELKVTHVLDGAVRKSGVRMRVNAQLTEAASGAVVWGERFDREIADAFVLQDDIAAKVAEALQQRLSRPRAAQRIDPVAYELYLRARPLATDWGVQYTQQAAVLLEQVVAREPDFAPAWALLAAARAFQLPSTHDTLGEPAHNAALAAANRALAIDPKCAEAYRALAMLKPAFSEYGEKVRLIETALSLAPEDTIIAHAGTIALAAVGRCRDGFDIGQRIVRAEPLSPFHSGIYVDGLYQVGRVDEALAMIDDAWRRWPESAPVWLTRWRLLLILGRIEEAERMCAPDMFPPNRPEGSFQIVQFVHKVMRLDHDGRRPLLEAVLSVDGQPYFALTMAQFAALAGHTDLAFDRTFAALDKRMPITSLIAVGGAARAYVGATLFHISGVAWRRDPRFAQLCARLGFVDYWHESGKWPDCVEEVAPHYDFKSACLAAASSGT